MSTEADESGRVIRVSEKGQATIPKELRERFGIDAPGKVYVHEEDGKIVVEPMPSVDDLKGVHAGEHGEGEVLDRLQQMKDEDLSLEEDG